MIEYIVKKRKITLLFFVMLIVVGTFGFFQLPQQEMPDVTIQNATVTTVYPGASPQKVEQTVTKELEKRIKEVEGVKTINSTSGNGFSSILIESKNGVDPQTVWDNMRKKVQDAQADLPQGAEVPVINDKLTSSFIGSYALTADSSAPLYKLNDLTTTWKDQLNTISGVSSVKFNGLPDQEVRIHIDNQKLQQYQLSWGQVAQAIQSQIDRVPTGNIEYNGRTYQLVVRETEKADELNQVILTRTKEGNPVYLRDIGTTELAHPEVEYFAYVEGKPAITLSIGAETGTDIPSMSAKVNSKLKELEKTLPAGVHLQTLFAQKDQVSHIFDDLKRETILAIAAVILVCMLGLNLLTSAFVALAIPISVSIAVIFLPMFGITLNQISVVGLIIVLGILVDDAVVVNDNIERRLTELGEPPSVAAIKGTKEVMLSILIATLATISAFAPLLFLPGNVGAFIRPIPTIVSLAMLASMIMSLTIIPIFREWYEKRRQTLHPQRKSKPVGLLGQQIHSLNKLYSQKLMPKVIQRPLLTAMVGLMLGTAAYGLVPFTSVELFPESEDPHVALNVKMPVGTSIAETDQVVKDLAGWIKKQPETSKVVYSAGGTAPQLFSDINSAGGTISYNETVGQIAVVGKENVFDLNSTVDAWEQHVKKSYPGVTVTMYVPRLGIPVGKPVSIRISGQDLNELQTLAQKAKEQIATVEGTTGIVDDIGIERYALELEVNKQAMDQYLVSYTDLTRTLLLLKEGAQVSQFDTGSSLVDIKMYLNHSNEEPSKLFQQLSVVNAAGKQIPLNQLVQIKPSFAIQQIKHYNMERTITVEADLNGRTASEAMVDVEGKLAQMKFPEGYKWEVGGETSDQSTIFGDLGKLAIVVVLLILLLITMQFYSLSIPIIIMTTVYLAAAGGIIGIFLTGMPIGFMSIMGIIALAGIVVRNGIVLIEFIEDARHEGVELREAVIQAAAARFRPILLTSLAAIVGMIPLALLGSLLFKPLAFTVIFGLLFSTLLTLFVVPSLYMIMAKYKMHRQLKKQQHTVITRDQPL
ncbi:efflux RND transporter permease subunit [Paenibacillus polymyxa]|uniref:efflux RND transporter permease subunit n=1 Tax=Paenibacillus polymyxa TaxID=1406 RepID=UPI000589EBDB|nr:efflux RND transporter permease subunit [Paenibacillus polymyxa]AJE52116.1 multidrug ABC transporter [Paenibacillus polymyxa]QOH64070.1 AcrB/AcrD/AcrF family protein [Paenibacillus polymyxa]